MVESAFILHQNSYNARAAWGIPFCGPFWFDRAGRHLGIGRIEKVYETLI